VTTAQVAPDSCVTCTGGNSWEERKREKRKQHPETKTLENEKKNPKEQWQGPRRPVTKRAERSRAPTIRLRPPHMTGVENGGKNRLEPQKKSHERK